MKLTKDQATKILNDFRHFDGRKISIKEGQLGEYPVVIVLPFDESISEKCRLDIYDRMRNNEQMIRVYDFGDIPYTVQVFFSDLIANSTLGKHTDLEKWLNNTDIAFDRKKYGIE